MARYIDADKTLAELDKFFDTHYWGNTALIDGVVRIVNNQKPADVAPVVHAHWIERNDKSYLDGLFECSNCSEFNGWRATYCPDCGAKMDGKEGGDK